MSQARDKRRNSLRAGIFVTVSIVLGITVVLILSDARNAFFQDNSDYRVSFPVEQGVGALGPGAAIRLGGVPVGSVNSVAPVQVDERVDAIGVDFEMASWVRLYADATITVRAGLLGSDAWLEITDVGRGELATPETPIQGTMSTMLAQLLGTDSEVDLRATLEALRSLSAMLAEDGGTLRAILGREEAKQVAASIESARQGLSAIQQVAESAAGSWPAWEASVTRMLDGAASLPEQLDGALGEAQGLIAELRARVLPSVEESMASMQRTAMNLEAMSRDLATRSPRWSEGISDIVANLDRISTRAKAAVDDIAASPWRLLYRPTDREIAFEQLNDASWRLAGALDELQDTAAAMRDAAAAAPDGADPEALSRLADTVAESEAAFEAARDVLLKRIESDFPRRGGR